MKEKLLHSATTVNRGYRTTETRLVLINERKYKLSYDCYNCGETFTGELFDGDKFNHMFSLSDLGVKKETNYHHTIEELRPRIDMLFKKGYTFLSLL